jgi:tetratricopeptide (TPR) repeat protein
MREECEIALSRVRRAQREGDTSELADAVRGLAAIMDLDTDPAGQVAVLASAYLQLFEQTGELEPLRMAQRAYGAAPARGGGRQAAIWRSYLGLCLVRESERAGRHDALDEALPLLSSAAADLPGNLTAHANLALGLQRQMERTADVGLLPDALAAGLVAGAAAIRRPGTRARILSNTSSTLMAAWELTGIQDHLDAAVQAGSDACALVPAGDPGVPGCTAALARALLARAEATGDRAAPTVAARQLSWSLRAVPSDDPDRPIYLNQLAIAHRMTFAATGDLAALDQAIHDWGEAVRFLPADHPDRATYRVNRAGALRNRFETVADAAALDEAVRDLEDVYAGIPDGDPRQPACRSGLANALHRKGADIASLDLLKRSADLLRAAAAEISTDRPEYREHRANLGAVLLSGARLGPDGMPLDEAIDLLTEATAGTGLVFGALLNLGDARVLRWERIGDPGDLEAAAEAYTQLVGSPAATALFRAMAAHSLGRLRVRTQDWGAARDSLGQAVELLDLVAWAGLGRDDQERLLLQFPALARTAAACALELDDPDDAVEILEQGRGVLYAQALTRWAGADEVRDGAPELAARLSAVHDLLEASHRAEQAAPWDRHRAVRERDLVITDIRGRPGLERFLRPPRLADLRARLGERTMVIVNVAAHRCDALLVTGTATHHVPLPDLTMEDTNRYAATAIRPDDPGLRDTLEWLWDTVAGPVLDRLDRDAPTGHVWWMPTGALSFLPIHAAGHHAPGDGTDRSALHRVVSSYAPTVRSLMIAGPPPVPDLAAVVAPAVRDGPGLPASLREAGDVRGRLGAAAVLVTGPDATMTRVRDLLVDAGWVHFAGHATADPVQPSDSHLALHDGVLRVRDILRYQARERTERTLAYLSACSTVQGGAGLPDENIHLTSALLLAGFGDVIATSWPVPDAVASRAARLTYEGLRTARPAAAVNATAKALRQRYPQRPSLWAAHVHVGVDHEIRFPTG